MAIAGSSADSAIPPLPAQRIPAWGVTDRDAQRLARLTGLLFLVTFATSIPALLVFYALAMQCMSTLAVVKKETGSWKWAALQFLMMSGLAYLGALLVYAIFA